MQPLHFSNSVDFRPSGDLQRYFFLCRAWLLLLLLLLPGTLIAAPGDYLERDDVQSWIADVVVEHALDEAYVLKTLAKAERIDKVIERISAPAEKKLSWAEYRPIFIKPERIEGGRAFLQEHAGLLQAAEIKFGVPAEVVVAIIGVETFYGRYRGRDQALSALATLAFDYPPRAKFFRRELAEFLMLAREESFDPEDIRGSYAAAMGMPQFISSSYRAYAVDFDEDGRRDLWDSKADVIGSVANYLQRHGWVSGEPIAERVSPEGDGYRNLLTGKLKPKWKRAELQQHGVRTQNNSIKEKSVMELKAKGGPEIWVGFQNFYAITRYNHSKLYAMAVYELSQKISNPGQ